MLGFYGSLTSTIPRLYKIAALYKSLGAKTVVGGKHTEYLPREALDNDIDVVVFGEGETVIQKLLKSWQVGTPLKNVPGVAFYDENRYVETGEPVPVVDFDDQPLPDFSLLRYARLKIYPVGSVRGCNMNCEFCAVKDATRCATPQRMLAQISNVVETRGCSKFFDVSDHFVENHERVAEFCRMLIDYQKKKNVRVKITIQTRLNDARHPKLLKLMKKAGIYHVCIGFESPIDEELAVMRKGYRSKDMLEWTRTFHRNGFFVHGMFIFGYPQKEDQKISISLQEKTRRFREFIRKTRLDTAQVLLPVPLPGTGLRDRLESEGRLYPLDQIGWEYYDGQFPIFEPDDGVSPIELQTAVRKIMSHFYHFRHLFRMIIHVVISFPVIVFPSVFTLVTFRAGHVKQAFLLWKKRCFRNPLIRFGGYLILVNWMKKFESSAFLQKLKQARKLQFLRNQDQTKVIPHNGG